MTVAEYGGAVPAEISGEIIAAQVVIIDPSDVSYVGISGVVGKACSCDCRGQAIVAQGGRTDGGEVAASQLYQVRDGLVARIAGHDVEVMIAERMRIAQDIIQDVGIDDGGLFVTAGFVQELGRVGQFGGDEGIHFAELVMEIGAFCRVFACCHVQAVTQAGDLGDFDVHESGASQAGIFFQVVVVVAGL